MILDRETGDKAGHGAVDGTGWRAQGAIGSAALASEYVFTDTNTYHAINCSVTLPSAGKYQISAIVAAGGHLSSFAAPHYISAKVYDETAAADLSTIFMSLVPQVTGSFDIYGSDRSLRTLRLCPSPHTLKLYVNRRDHGGGGWAAGTFIMSTAQAVTASTQLFYAKVG